MKIRIIGGNPMGLSAASGIRRAHPNWDIVVYEKDQYISYGSCGIPYYIEDKVKRIEDLITLTVDDMYDKRKVPVKINHEVTGVDFNTKTIIVHDIQQNIRLEDNYDKLIIAVGGKSFIPKKLQIKHPRVFHTHTLAEAEKLKKFLTLTPVEKVVIVGAGYIGLEMVEVYKSYQVSEIHLVDNQTIFNSPLKSKVIEELLAEGVVFHSSDLVESLIPIDPNYLRVRLTNDEIIDADLVHLAVGVIPNTEMFQDTELEMLTNGAIKINGLGQTNIPDVYAGGDCATIPHFLSKKDVYVPLAPIANKMGRLVGKIIAGAEKKPFSGIIGTAILKVLGKYCAMTGLKKDQAELLGINVGESVITAREIAHYYPNSEKMDILLRYDLNTQIIIGAEIVAPSPLGAKKIDVFATAIQQKMTIEDLQQLDLAYAPPFAPVWDPILITANVALKDFLKHNTQK